MEDVENIQYEEDNEDDNVLARSKVDP